MKTQKENKQIAKTQIIETNKIISVVWILFLLFQLLSIIFQLSF